MAEPSLHRPLPASTVGKWDLCADVVVVGFGAAGACAAIEAAEAGAKVILLERNSGSGGASALSGGEIYIGGGGGTDAQRAAGFNDSTSDFERYLRLAGGPCANDAKCAVYARDALDHYAWLKVQGVPYRGNYLAGKLIEPSDDSTLIWSGSEAAAPFCDEAEPAPRGHVIQHMGWGGGRLLIDILEKRARELGVQVVTDANVKGLVEDRGRITGVAAKVDGTIHFVRARRGVVLASGGFVMNEEMRRKFCPQTFRINDPIGDRDDGCGIAMGVGAGGEAVHMDQFFTTCPWTMPAQQAHGVFVNIHGQRFINEDCYHGRVSRHAVDQDGGKVFLLLDIAHFSQPADFARLSIAATGNSWEEVENELGMVPGTLSRTMEIYNEQAAVGKDPLFGKRPPILVALDKPPFVALELNFETSYFSFFTLGGSTHRRMAKSWPLTAGRCRDYMPQGAAPTGYPRGVMDIRRV